MLVYPALGVMLPLGLLVVLLQMQLYILYIHPTGSLFPPYHSSVNTLLPGWVLMVAPIIRLLPIIVSTGTSTMLNRVVSLGRLLMPTPFMVTLLCLLVTLVTRGVITWQGLYQLVQKLNSIGPDEVIIRLVKPLPATDKIDTTYNSSHLLARAAAP